MPVLYLYIIICKRPLGQNKCHRLGFPRFQLHFGKVFQLFHRTDDAALLIPHIKLDDFFPRHLPAVGHVHGNRQAVRILHASGAELQVGIRVFRIGQPMPEGKQYLHLLFVIITVTHENSFLILHGIALAGEIQIGRIVFQFYGKCLRQFRAGIDFPEQDIIFRTAYRLSAQIRFHHAFYAVNPRHFHGRTVMEHHHYIRLYGSHLTNQLILAFRHTHMLPVKPFRLKRIGQTRKNHCRFRLSGTFHRFRQQFPVSPVFFITEALGITDTRISCRSIHRRSHFMAVDVGTAAALITGFFGIFSDKGDFLSFLQGKDTVVF